MSGAELARQADRAGDVHARGRAHAEAFVLQQVEADRDQFFVGDPEGVVDGQAFEVGGDASLANALCDRAAFRLELPACVIM